jgi:hypothetical protein
MVLHETAQATGRGTKHNHHHGISNATHSVNPIIIIIMLPNNDTQSTLAFMA